MLMLISGIGPKFARVIVQLRQGSGNLDLDILEVLIRRSLSVRELDQLDFTVNPMLAAAFQASGTDDDYLDWEPLSRSRVLESGFRSTSYLDRGPEAQERIKAELASQISELEADITATLEQHQIQRGEPLAPRRLLTKRCPVVAGDIPTPFENLTSRLPILPRSLAFPRMRPDRAIERPRRSSPCRSVVSEASSMALPVHNPWRTADHDMPTLFRETSVEYLGHFRAPRSPPASLMRPCPTHFTMPSNQPVASGVSQYNNKPVSSGVSLPSNQPVVSGVSLYNNQPVVSGVSLYNNQPVASGVSLPSNQPVVSGVS
ncbi:hypothetical protein DPMN_126703 [Dreissena polymorpha]|uniref:Uncharacterized protein n=1 Tax=Dreissena polymorpha TaxID=45954 RepID=A0A9D4H0M2_DREPO|nr:hypothetical protein DPMN_126703 [Dreissena polymorpha]